MVGIVVVSHSAELARGVVELARQMGGEEVRIEEAGGMDDGSIGTDAARVQAAIERAMSDDGVLVLMDLGSALMSAEMAVELMEGDGRVVLSEAPLVEGAVAAAAAARGGASLDEVRGEAGRAFLMKQAQLGTEEAARPSAEPASTLPEPDARATIPVLNEIGLHARPAALVVELAGRFDAELRLGKEGGPGPVSARSLTGLMTLLARKGDHLQATASGPQAGEAVAALEELAAEGFGEGVASSAAVGAPQPISEPAAPAAAPQAGEVLSGIAASAGIAMGPARYLDRAPGAPSAQASQGADVERHRLDAALAAAREAIEHDRDTVAGRGAAKEAEIFTAHVALLDDEALLERARALIDGGDSAEAAWHAAGEETAAQWRSLGDRLLAERAADVDDVGRRVLTALAGGDAGAVMQEAGIVVADELTPRDTAALDPDLVQAVATARGTATAHAAILARALGIPAVVGLGGSVLAIAEGTPLLLDGQAGTVLVSPDDAQAAAARSRAADLDERRRVAREHAGEPTVMRDGTVIEVFANLGGAGQASAAVEMGAEGVGLLRTEFLFLERAELPSEDEQVQTLAAIAADLGGRPLIVRTLDVGADKPLQAVPMEPEANPFLGRRGLRLSLARPELLTVQLRAILRVAAEHPLKVMFPMVSTAAELDAALALLEQARGDTGVRAPLDAGIMVEVPAAALLAEQLAARARFFSVGTNDLTQYTMAAERGNELVGDLLAGAQPAVLRLIRLIAAGAAVHGRTVAVCGELAGDPAAAVLLVGLGVRELSMAPPLIAEVKQALRSVTLVDAITAADHAVNAPDATAARAVADALL
ncbi:MAG TPA: phosphoenolpyruvate--protein phosphotransferase [Solirubrobacteraceae bacterium]|nr:phosphoenolpyruvate--protein phosphotransferase [Solirubrobacteraceae bacterium]